MKERLSYLLLGIGISFGAFAQEKPKPALTGKPVILPESEEEITTPPRIVTEMRVKIGDKWGNDVIIRSGAYNRPSIERKPGEDDILFALFEEPLSSNSYRYYLYKSTNGGETWQLKYTSPTYTNVTAAYTVDLAVTNDYVFVVYTTSTGGDEDIFMKKFDMNGNPITFYPIATSSYPERHPAIATDAEYYSSNEWLYVVWQQNDIAPGTEIYFRVFDEEGDPVSDPIGIFGAGSSDNYEYPDIAYDNRSSGNVHVVAWNTTHNQIWYRGATGFGNDPDEWGAAFYYSPPSGWVYRLPNVDAEGDRVLIAWECCKSDYSEVYQYFAYSTNGGIDASNFTASYFTTQYWRPVAVLKNTSSKWYMLKWKKVGSCWYLYRNYATSPGGTWYYEQVSDNGYSLLPWFSFGGTTLGDDKLAAVWTDGDTHVAFDGEWRAVPDIAVDPTEYDYGDVTVGDFSDKEFEISNTGSANLHVSGAYISGSNDFSIIEGDGSHTVPPGGSYDIVVRYSPSSEGPDIATLKIYSDDPDENPFNVDLQGNGVVPQPPTAYIDDITPNPAEQGQNVCFYGHGEDPDGYIIGYEWRSSIDGFLSSEQNFCKDNLSPGEHIISFRVKDNDNQWSGYDYDTLMITAINTKLTLIWVPTNDIKGQPMLVEVEIENQSPYSSNLLLELKEGDQVYDSKYVDIEPYQTKIEHLEWNTENTTTGLHSLTVWLEPYPGELYTDDNEANFNVNIEPENYAKSFFITSFSRIADYYGNSWVDSLHIELYKFVTLPSVKGIVINVTDDVDVSNAFSMWDADPTNQELANDVAEAIKNLIDNGLEEYVNIEYIVLVGNSNVIPYYRVPENLLNFGGGFEYRYNLKHLLSKRDSAALAQNYILSDGYYGGSSYNVWTNFYIPETRAVSRLIEHPQEVINLMREYEASGGNITMEHALVASMGRFLRLSPRNVWASNCIRELRDIWPLLEIDSLIGNGWTSNDLKNEMLETAHHDMVALDLPGSHISITCPGNTSLSAYDIYSSSNNNLVKSCVLSLTCHGGLNSNTSFDLPQAYAQQKSFAYIGKTSSALICIPPLFDEGFFTTIIEYLDSLTIGKAVVRAKKDYYLTQFVYPLSTMAISILLQLISGGPSGGTIGEGAVIDLELWAIRRVLAGTNCYGFPFVSIPLGKIWAIDGNSFDKSNPKIEIEKMPPKLLNSKTNLIAVEMIIKIPEYDCDTLPDSTVIFTAGGGYMGILGLPILPKLSTPLEIQWSNVFAHDADLINVSYQERASALPVATPKVIISDDTLIGECTLYNWFPSIPFTINRMVRPSGEREERFITITAFYKPSQNTKQPNLIRLCDTMRYEIYFSSSNDTTDPEISNIYYYPETPTTYDSIKLCASALDPSGIYKVDCAYATFREEKWHRVQMVIDSITECYTALLGPFAAPDTLIYYYVIAVDNAGNVAYSTIDSISIIVDTSPPVVPSPVNPPNGSYIKENFINFVWRSSIDNLTGIAYYVLQCAKDSDFVELAIDTTIVDTILTAVLDDGTYYWRIKSVDNASNESNWSQVWWFEIDTHAPSIPTLLSPTGGIYFDTTVVAFEWTAVKFNRSDIKSPVRYLVEVDTTQNFASPLIIDTTANTYDTFDLNEGFYYWHVMAFDLAGNQSMFSSPDSFGIDIMEPSVVSLISPVDGDYSNDVGIDFIWHKATDNLSGIAYYTLQYDIDSGFINPVDTIICDTTVSLELNESRYYWRVCATDNAGNVNSWSEVWWFEIDTTLPEVPLLISPEDSAYIDSINVLFKWSNVSKSSPVHYVFEIDTIQMFNTSYVDTLDTTAIALALQEARHYWHVKAFDGAGNESDFSSIRTLVVDTTSPAVIALVSPDSEAMLNDSLVTFIWHEGNDNLSGIQYYVLQYDNNAEFTLPKEIRVTDTFYSTVLPDTTYYWRVKSFDRSGNESNWSQVWWFEIDTHAPGIPTLLSPPDSSILGYNAPTFIWSSATKAKSTSVSYKLRIISCDTLLYTTDDTTYMIEDSLPDTIYLWQVMSLDAAGNSSNWTLPFMFVIDTRPPVIESTTVWQDTCYEGPFPVCTKVTDINTVDTVYLCYKTSIDTNWKYLLMNPIDSMHYSAEIPKQDSESVTIYYYIRAYDAATPPNIACDPAGAPDTCYTFVAHVVAVTELIPSEFFIQQNYPNPFTHSTIIEFGIPKSTHVEISVYSLLGRKVATLVNKYLKPGYHRIEWRGTNSFGDKLPAGVYFYCMTAGEFTFIRKLFIIE